MKFQPSNPFDLYHSQIEYENFKEEQANNKKLLDNIENISKSANKKSWFSIIMAILSFLISLLALLISFISEYDNIMKFLSSWFG